MKHLMNKSKWHLTKIHIMFFLFFPHVLVLGARDVFPGAGEDLQREDGGGILNNSTFGVCVCIYIHYII